MPPQDVQDFSVNIVGDDAHLSWTPVTDLDLSHYKIVLVNKRLVRPMPTQWILFLKLHDQHSQ